MIAIYDNEEIERRNIIFNRRNCLKIAREYDAEITKWEPELRYCVLKDSLDRLIFIEGRK